MKRQTKKVPEGETRMTREKTIKIPQKFLVRGPMKTNSIKTSFYNIGD